MLAVPAACLNDGLLDLCLHQGPDGGKAVLKWLKNCVVNKGQQIYDDRFNGHTYLRARSLRIKNKNLKADSAIGETEPQMFQIDGEDLWFDDFVKIEVVPGAVDLLVNYKEMMQQKNLMRPSPKL